MIVGLHHVAVSTPDLETAIDFYAGVLGAEVVQQSGWDGDFPLADKAIGLKNSAAKMAMIRLGNAYIELWQYENPAPKTKDKNYPPSDHGIAHFCLQVKDIQAEYDRLTAAGMTFVGPPQDFGGSWAVYGRDPFGNIIEIYEPPQELHIPAA